MCYGGFHGKTIVFAQTKADANQVILSDRVKIDAEVLHGDIAQSQREVTLKRKSAVSQIIAGFKESKFKVLVATDVASRGLDIPNVDLVIQLEPPKEVETYIHRSGRTARAGKAGTCITFYSKKQQSLLSQIEDRAGVRLKKIGAPQPEDIIRASSRDVLTSLNKVEDGVLPLFVEAADVSSLSDNLLETDRGEGRTEGGEHGARIHLRQPEDAEEAKSANWTGELGHDPNQNQRDLPRRVLRLEPLEACLP